MSEATIFLPVGDAYDRWSGFYDTYENPMVFGASQVVEHLAEQVAGQDVLEFGCGTGRNLARLKQGGAASLMGCDLSTGMLARLGHVIRSCCCGDRTSRSRCCWPTGPPTSCCSR